MVEKCVWKLTLVKKSRYKQTAKVYIISTVISLCSSASYLKEIPLGEHRLLL